MKLPQNAPSYSRFQVQDEATASPAPLILPFTAIDAQMHDLVGGKAANLGELTRAGFSVPDGFCLTTAAYASATENANLEPVLSKLAQVTGEDRANLEAYATTARNQMMTIPVPENIIAAIREAYEHLAQGEAIPVAVRSSATAEDLAFASFAGQQDTYLNIVGVEAVIDAVRRCWASLWTDRAVTYRASNGIDHRTVRLAVVVQRLIDAQVAGVLFTANPLTGQRHQAVIDANPGLGEAVVSGAVNPDHFVVNARSCEIVECHLGDKSLMIQATPGGGTQEIAVTNQVSLPCLSNEQVADLTQLGLNVETHYGVPQDIEWAIDSNNQLWVLQARPITTLFPLPAAAPTAEEDLRVYFCFNVLQGVYRPFTPMGFAALRVMASSFARCLGYPVSNVLDGPPVVAEAGHRLFLDVTAMLRNPKGLAVMKKIMGRLEARSGTILQQLATDPRLLSSPNLTRISRGAIVRRVLATLFRERIPLYVAQVLLCPNVALHRVLRLQEELQAQSQAASDASAEKRLEATEQLLLHNPASITCNVLFTALPAFLLTVLAGKLLGNLVKPDERQTVLRALPHNPTTEMDLAIWELAQRIRKDGTATHLFLETPLEQLVQDYSQGALPQVLQQGLREFLAVYGHRGVAEIDLGLPRWFENPEYILGVLTNYLQLDHPELAPDVLFRKGEQEAEAMLTELVQRAKKQSWLRSKLVSFCLRRGRALSGLREAAKYYLVLLLAEARRLLMTVGKELSETGQLQSADDIFFIDIAEARQALAGTDFRKVVAERRASYEHEVSRRHVPRVLLSDGTTPDGEAQMSAIGADETEDTLKGIPASAGRVTAKAKVILNPVGAKLEPGEILVAPSTDPGWTPLFLTASGMVMEMGGPMSHGAVVAREYGIPAVVGVPDATKRIITGQLITIDGSSGTVMLEQSAS